MWEAKVASGRRRCRFETGLVSIDRQGRRLVRVRPNKYLWEQTKLSI